MSLSGRCDGHGSFPANNHREQYRLVETCPMSDIVNTLKEAPGSTMKQLHILGSGSLVFALAFGSGLEQPVQAAMLTPEQRVDLAVNWFTGLFSNQNQVAGDPEIPFLTMENCSVSPLGGGQVNAEYVHLEQYIGGSQLLRTAAYEFSPSDLGVNLSVFPYLDDDAALGTCAG